MVARDYLTELALSLNLIVLVAGWSFILQLVLPAGSSSEAAVRFIGQAATTALALYWIHRKRYSALAQLGALLAVPIGGALPIALLAAFLPVKALHPPSARDDDALPNAVH